MIPPFLTSLTYTLSNNNLDESHLDSDLSTPYSSAFARDAAKAEAIYPFNAGYEEAEKVTQREFSLSSDFDPEVLDYSSTSSTIWKSCAEKVNFLNPNKKRKNELETNLFLKALKADYRETSPKKLYFNDHCQYEEVSTPIIDTLHPIEHRKKIASPTSSFSSERHSHSVPVISSRSQEEDVLQVTDSTRSFSVSGSRDSSSHSVARGIASAISQEEVVSTVSVAEEELESEIEDV